MMTNRTSLSIVVGLLMTLWPLLCSTLDARADDGESAVPALMNILKDVRLPPERVGTVVELICKQGNANDLSYVYAQSIKADGYSPQTRLDALRNLAAATINRKVRPQADLADIGRLIHPAAPKRDRQLQQVAIQLAGLWKVRPVAGLLQKIALNNQANLELRRAAIESLMSIGGKTALETVEKLATADFSPPVRFLAVAGMTELDLNKAASLAVGVLQDAAADDDPSSLIAAFLAHKAGPGKLAGAIGSGKIPVDVAKQALRYMYSVGRSDASLSAALAKAAGINTRAKPLSEQEIMRLTVEVLEKGDTARGEDVFRRADVSCMKCHAVSKAGGDVGPDLSALGSSSPIDYVVKSILLPNQAVKEQYRASVVITTDGKVFTGIVKERNAERIVIKEATGKERVIHTDDIDDEVQGKSLMPQGLTKFLTHQDLIDLVRFLSVLGKPGPYAIRTTPTIQRWRVLKPVPEELISAVPDDVLFREKVLETDQSRWAAAYGKVAGLLPLDELGMTSRTAVIFLQGEVDVTETGRVVFRVNSAEGLHVWIDDEPFGSEQKIDTNLSTGRHKITLRVDTKARESREVKVEVVKAKDSAVEFTVVGGP
jgi:putative heme-binding domain-containing protein